MDFAQNSVAFHVPLTTETCHNLPSSSDSTHHLRDFRAKSFSGQSLQNHENHAAFWHWTLLFFFLEAIFQVSALWNRAKETYRKGALMYALGTHHKGLDPNFWPKGRPKINRSTSIYDHFSSLVIMYQFIMYYVSSCIMIYYRLPSFIRICHNLSSLSSFVIIYRRESSFSTKASKLGAEVSKEKSLFMSKEKICL